MENTTTSFLQPAQQIRWAVLEMMGRPSNHSDLALLAETAAWVETGTLARTITPPLVPEIAHDDSIPPAAEAPTPTDASRGAAGCRGDQPHPVAADLDPAAPEGAAGEPGDPSPAGGDEEAGGEVPADLTPAHRPSDLGRRTPEVVAAIRALAAAGEPATSAAIGKASGIPRGSMTAALTRACQDGAVRRVETGTGTLYELASPPPAGGDDEAMKQEWLASHTPSTAPNLGPHAEMVEWMKANMSMFIGRLPAGQRGRFSWRYGASSVSTTELYALGNAERARRGLPPIPRPVEGR